MSCERWEEPIALYVEGDLAGPRPVEEHLRGCSGCREFAAEIRASQAALKDLGDEPVDPALLAAIRARVLDRVAAPPRRLAWWLAPVAAALLVVLSIPKEEPLVVRTPAPPRAPEIARSTVARPPAPLRRVHRVARRQAESSAPLVIKILTEDPDVVIYWVGE